MDNSIKDIVKKFLEEEDLPTNAKLMLGSLGLTKSTGNIAELVYGIKFSEHSFGEERRKNLAEFLGSALLNWYVLAEASGFEANEIVSMFCAEWQSKHKTTERVSIKDLLKYLKPSAKQKDTQDKQIN